MTSLFSVVTLLFRVARTARVTNQEILRRVNTGRELLGTIRTKQMGFLGHIMRQQGLENLSLTGKIEGKKSRGRPRQKYMDGLIRAAQGRMSANQLLQLTMNREECRHCRAIVADVPRDMAP